MVVANTSCCGMKEIQELSEHTSALEAMKFFSTKVYGVRLKKPLEKNGFVISYYSINPQAGEKFRYAVFTEHCPESSRYGKDFKAFIIKHSLGDVIETKSNNNPNSGNNVIVYVWTVNHDNLRSWWEANGGQPV